MCYTIVVCNIGFRYISKLMRIFFFSSQKLFLLPLVVKDNCFSSEKRLPSEFFCTWHTLASFINFGLESIHKGYLDGYLLHRTCVFEALRLFFLPNFPGPTFIPCPMSIPEARVGQKQFRWFLEDLNTRKKSQRFTDL